MHKPAVANDTFESSLLARLDSQDIIYTKLIRDYLTSAGCTVVENHEAQISCHYHIIYGDKNFVKRILEMHGKLSDRVLVISWDPSTKTIPKIVAPHVKLVLAGSEQLDEGTIPMIFNFFFTSSTPLLDLRKGEGRSEKKTAPTDQERIDTLIDDIFEQKQVTKRPFPSNNIRWGSVILFLLVLPIFLYLATLGGSILSYVVGSKVLTRGDSAASVKAAQVGVGLSRAGKFLVSMGLFDDQERLFSFLIDTGLSLVRLGSTVAQARDMGSILLSDENAPVGVHPAVTLDRLRTQVASLTVDVGLIQAEFARLSRDRVFPVSMVSVLGFEDDLDGYIRQARQLLSDIDGVLMVYRQAGGFSRAQTYLVLFQNSMELRPTGGFIGSVGNLSLVDGRIDDFTIWDVYELDGQLRGHVDPPEPIRTLLGEEHWYLRDSNWDRDFAVSAARAAWFYEKEMSKNVDGVIGLTSALIPGLLTAVGPIELSDYNDRITAENFYGKALFYTKEDFFPGSTQKKDFLGSLARGMFARLESGSKLNTSALLGAIMSGLTSGDIQLYFSESSNQQFVEAQGWSGRMLAVAANEIPLAIVDSNLGVNKANFFVSSEIGRDIEIDNQDNLTETVIYTQNNKGDGRLVGEDPIYKSYTRFYLSGQARWPSVTMNGVSVPRIVEPSVKTQLPYWNERIEHERVVIGVAATLLAGQNRRIDVTYTASGSSVLDQSLFLTTRAQAGAGPVPLTLAIRAPADHVMTVEDGQVASAGQLRYNTTLLGDSLVRVTFSP